MGKTHTLIVGGTRGAGRAAVDLFAQKGHVLSVIGRSLSSEQDKQAGKAHYWAADLVNHDILKNSLAEIVSQNGRLNNLVFYQRFRGDTDDWAGEIETSLTGTKNTIESAKDLFAPDGGKSIAVVSSIASQLIAPEQPLSYHLGKAGLNQMVRYYAVVLGAAQIRINSVSPGSILKEESKQFYLQNEELLELYKNITPLNRMCTSEDVARAVAFFCSPDASFITGQNLVIDGGISLQWQESLARQLSSLKNLCVTRPTKRSSL